MKEESKVIRLDEKEVKELKKKFKKAGIRVYESHSYLNEWYAYTEHKYESSDKFGCTNITYEWTFKDDSDDTITVPANWHFEDLDDMVKQFQQKAQKYFVEVANFFFKKANE